MRMTNVRNLPCGVLGCDKPKRTRGWCGTHYSRWHIHGNPETIKRSPKGSGWLDGTGYRRQCTNGDNGRPQHQLVWEAVHGTIPDGYELHHINEIRDDNRIENLQLMDRSEHRRAHKIKHVGCIVDDCDRPHYGLRFCETHWAQLRRWGYTRPFTQRRI